MAKEPPSDEKERAAILKLACGFLCRFISETRLMRQVDVVVAIPPDTTRYARRGMSLPDALAQAVEDQLAIPWIIDALAKTTSIELRGLSPTERQRAVRDSMICPNLGLAMNRCVLLLDDVVTSGATLREAAQVLRSAGVSDVHAVTLSHAEG